MALGKKTGGRRKGSRNKIPSDKRAAIERATSLAELDGNGVSMGHIQISAARRLYEQANQERAKGEAAQQDVVIRLLTAACRIAHGVSPWLYPLQSIKLGGDEDAPAIRIETMSEHELEVLISRLSKG
jgi:hypothetical protein